MIQNPFTDHTPVPVSLVTLENDNTLIKSETMFTKFDTVSGDVMNRFRQYLGDARGFFKNTVDGLDLTFFGFNGDTALDHKLAKINYVNMMNIPVYTAPNMMGNAVLYLTTLISNQEVANKVLDEVLKPAKQYVSILLNNPETLTSSLPSMHLQIQLHTGEIANGKKEIATFFSETGMSNSTETTFGKMYKSLNEWKEANDLAEELTKTVAKVGAKEVAHLTTELNALLQRLLLRFQQDPDTYSTNGITAQTLGTMIFNIGVELEFYGMMQVMTRQFIHALNDTKKQLQDITK